MNGACAFTQRQGGDAVILRDDDVPAPAEIDQHDIHGISAGPVKTVAASGIKDFGKLLHYAASAAPLRRNVTIDDVGNVAAFLMSDLAAGVTAEITYVDCGFSQTAGLSADMVG